MKFSVLMSVYAGECPGFLKESMQSLAAQTFVPDEVVVVEDGPVSEDLKAVLDSFQSTLKIKIKKLEKNSGLAAALNEGMKFCEYELVARMDSDDICLPDRFEKQVAKFVGEPELDVVGCFAIEIDENGKSGSLRSVPSTHEEIVASLWACPFIHPSVMFRGEKLKKIGGYDISLRRRQDYELWFRCAHSGFRFANLKEPLLLYRFNKDTHKKQPSRLALEQAIIGYKGCALMGMPVWKRFACFVPLLRSLLPGPIQHTLYLLMRRFDPRQRDFPSI
jgi:glycosyltransferase involved in cell wall biosynthesis